MAEPATELEDLEALVAQQRHDLDTKDQALHETRKRLDTARTDAETRVRGDILRTVERALDRRRDDNRDEAIAILGVLVYDEHKLADRARLLIHRLEHPEPVGSIDQVLADLRAQLRQTITEKGQAWTHRERLQERLGAVRRLASDLQEELAGALGPDAARRIADRITAATYDPKAATDG